MPGPDPSNASGAASTIPSALGRVPEAHVGSAPERVGWRFVTLYALSYTGGSLLFLAPLLVSLALKVNDLVGIEAAPRNLAMVTGIASLFSIVANPLFGRLSDRTTSRMGMRRPWMVIGVLFGAAGTLAVATATNIAVVLLGWCVCQVFFNAILAAQTAVLPDQVPSEQRGMVSGLLGLSVPVASVVGTYLVQAFRGSLLLMFLMPCAVGGAAILLFAWRLPDRRLDPQGKPPWSLRELAGTFYVNPRRNPDFAWAFLSRFLFVMAYAFLVTYQAYYLIAEVGSAEADVARHVYLGTVVQSVCLIVVAPMAGRLSDHVGRRKPFVMAAAVVYAAALVIVAESNSVEGYFVAMAIGGVGFGMYTAIDLALVVDVLTDPLTAAKDLGVLNIAGAMPFALAPALAPGLLALGHNSYSVLYLIAAACALGAAVAAFPIRRAA